MCGSGLVSPPDRLLTEKSRRVPDLTLGTPRGGSEVRNMEAARSEHVSAGRRGDRAGNAAPARAGTALCGQCAVVCGVCVGRQVDAVPHASDFGITPSADHNRR